MTNILIFHDMIIHLETLNSPKNVGFRILSHCLLLRRCWLRLQLYITAHEKNPSAWSPRDVSHIFILWTPKGGSINAVCKHPMMGIPHFTQWQWSQPCHSQCPAKGVKSQSSRGCSNEVPSNQKVRVNAGPESLNGHDKQRKFSRSVQSSECGLPLLNS